MTNTEVEGVPIGQHPLVAQLMKGVYKLRPPKPQYTYTWDVDMVTKYIEKLGDNTDLPLRKLTLKLALLMALTVASRTLELQALDLKINSGYIIPAWFCFALWAPLRPSRLDPPKRTFFRCLS